MQIDSEGNLWTAATVPNADSWLLTVYGSQGKEQTAQWMVHTPRQAVYYSQFCSAMLVLTDTIVLQVGDVLYAVDRATGSVSRVFSASVTRTNTHILHHPQFGLYVVGAQHILALPEQQLDEPVRT